MKQTIKLFAIMVLAITAAACTHNNGDIGDLFGTWQITGCKVAGIDLRLPGNEYVSFQGDVVNFRQVDEVNKTYIDHGWGNWTRTNDDLSIILSDNWFNKTNLPEAPTGPSITLHIDSLTPSSMELSYEGKNEGSPIHITVYLKKIP